MARVPPMFFTAVSPLTGWDYRLNLTCTLKDVSFVLSFSWQMTKRQRLVSEMLGFVFFACLVFFLPVFILMLGKGVEVRNCGYLSSVVVLHCDRLLFHTCSCLCTPASLKQTPVTSLGE